jgi:hypothetical protein
LLYAASRGGFALDFTHGTSGGSGVLLGSTNDYIDFSVNHALSRLWSGQVHAGYSRHTPLASAGQTNTQTYNTWSVGGGVSRPMGRYANLALSYTAQFTDYGLAGCTGTACTNNQTYHYVTINFQWHTRPFILE